MVVCIRLALQEGSKDEWTTHFSGYVITLLVIFYFQITKKLPSVASLQEDVRPVVKCGGELSNIERMERNKTIVSNNDRTSRKSCSFQEAIRYNLQGSPSRFTRWFFRLL